MNKEIVKLIEERIEKGKRKYADEINPHDGREWVQEALEEALDLTVYLAVELIRIKELNDEHIVIDDIGQVYNPEKIRKENGNT